MIRTALSVALAVISVTIASGSLMARPALTIDQLEFDFGYAPQNSKISHLFRLRNDGDDTLRITRVIPGCGCTQAPLRKSTLAPGESTELEIIFNTGHYSGPVTKRPKIETNETSAQKNITILTNVVQRPDSTYPVQTKPYKLDLSQFGETVRDEMKYTLANVSDQDLDLTLVSCPDELLTVKVPKHIAAGASANGLVKLTPTATGKSFETSITIQLNDKAATRFTIPIKRSVYSPEKEVASSGPDGK